ncbi:MAG: zinc ABC transporter substrate-binding protein [Candidatus Paceibacterota bacterium]|jgi:zinc transport system substrate-binding protein
MNKKTATTLIFAVLVLFVFAWKISEKNIVPPSPSDRMLVTASFYPLAFLAEEIGGNKVQVVNFTPTGAEPHEYEPSPRDMANMERSRVLIVNGLGLEPWILSVQKNINPQTTFLLVAGEGKDISRKGDPHIWLSPAIMYGMAKKIALTFSEVDAANGATYLNNLEIFKNKINALGDEYRSGLSHCKSKSFVTSHNAFGYLADNYGLEQISIAGLSPDAEPSPKQLTDIVTFAKKNNVKYIFFESLASPELSQMIADEIGAKTLVLNPLEGLTAEEERSGKNYLSIMRDNLANLQTALSCSPR